MIFNGFFFFCIILHVHPYFKRNQRKYGKSVIFLVQLATFLKVLVYCFNFEFIYTVFLYIFGTHLIHQKRIVNVFFKTIQTIHCAKNIDCTFTMRFKVLQRGERYEKNPNQMHRLKPNRHIHDKTNNNSWQTTKHKKLKT